MSFIHNFISDADLKKDTARNLKIYRALEQKELYLGERAKQYYSKRSKKANFTPEDYIEFGKQNFFSQNKKTAFISVGCGNAEGETAILEDLCSSKEDFTYFGVDSSLSMLELAMETLKKNKFTQHYVWGDFTSEQFHHELIDLVKKFDYRVFAFLGGTLSNTPQAFTADAFRNMLKKGDYLWLDVHARENTNTDADGDLFELYLQYINAPKNSQWLFLPLKQLGIPYENGELSVEMITEKSVGALKFVISFLFHKKTTFKLNDEIITVLPDDHIQILTIRTYDLNALARFFQARNFKIISKEIIKNRGQIALMKR